MENEKQTVEKCRQGNLQDFEKLYDSYFERIYNFIYYRTSHKETTEDLTSKTFISALESISRFDPEKGSFASWIFRIARNKVIDYYRTKKKEIDLSKVCNLKSKEDIIAGLDIKKKMDEIKTFLSKLDLEKKEIIMMRAWDNLSYREIAEITGKSEASCKMVFSRAASRIKEELCQ